MQTALRFAWSRAARILMGGTIATAFYMSFIIAGPIIEAKYFPVVTFQELIQQRDGDKIHIDTMFSKIRGCEYVTSNWYAKNREGEFVDVAVNYNNQANGQTRPVGKAYDRNWIITLPHDDVYETLSLVISYRCGFPWQTLTMVGPIKIPQY